MKVEDVLACSFDNWYNIFKNITIESVVLSLPCNVLNYLQDNGTLVLPEESYNNPVNSNAQKESSKDGINSDEENEEHWEHDENDIDVVTPPNLNDFNVQIKKIIKRLGGNVFPKLNWSSPKDATWISFNKSLQCSNPSDVYLLIKSSDFVAHDLTSPFKDCSDKEIMKDINYNLVLRKWVEINPSDEFRCFVKDRELIAISQRDTSQHYPSIHKQKDCIVTDILLFWEDHIRNYFPLMSYVFDVHRPKDDQVILIDFGPFGVTTDSLMFSWVELLEKKVSDFADCQDSNRLSEESENFDIEPEFRYIANATGVQPSPYMRYGLPVDVVELSISQSASVLSEFLQTKIRDEGRDLSSDENDENSPTESTLSSPSNSDCS